MSHIRRKVKYNDEGPWGTTVERTLYVDHNIGCDMVSFYDEDGDCILSVPDTIKNNILDAINEGYSQSGGEEWNEKLPKPRRFKRVFATQDESGHWYVIPIDKEKRWIELGEKAGMVTDDKQLDEVYDQLAEEFNQYRTGGNLNLIELYTNS